MKKGKRGPTVGVLIGLTLLVALLHLWLTGRVLQDMPSLQPDTPAIERMQAAYVSEVQLTQPPAAPKVMPVAPPAAAARAPLAQKPKRKKAPKPAEPASAAELPASEAEPSVMAAASAPDAPAASQPEAPPAARATETAQAPAQAEPSASGANQGEAFVWPVATRVSYKMEGFFRGPVYGQAAVEWVRKDSRYQVHIEASVGPSFAPLGSWRLTSEGDILPEGLYPRLYENMNRLLIKTSAPRLIRMDDEVITLPDGKQHPREPGMQDPASFMIQVAYQFVIRPERLQPGRSFEMTVATMRKPEPLVFDVVTEELLDTPLGRIPTLHVRPRKAVVDGGALPADVWFAPGLQYLPVRISMKMKDDVWMELKLDRAPQQTRGDVPPSAAPSSPQPPAPAP